ncbi:transmembrane inner ear expressed protein isoform X1 [Anastrepha obliqua]|uniref:transmembrane inner ear expressed protein isoform X1 n=1 Tax=Anastrepha obliqua TaxID=95512 RepID=UPI002409F98B|nr:transmembrane inner ear expressed protein isoform X1 [Anastrepha obliqua]
MSAEEESETAWLETVTIGGFRAWHIIAICLGISLSILIMVCCCIRFRIPRTKQEIEADYQRKQITKKFREKLQQIKNSEMDEMDLQKGHSKKESTDVDRKITSILQENLCPYLPNIAGTFRFFLYKIF